MVCVDGLGGSVWWLQQTAWTAKRRGGAGSRAQYGSRCPAGGDGTASYCATGAVQQLRSPGMQLPRNKDVLRQHAGAMDEESQYGPEIEKGDVETVMNARRATANAVASNLELAVDRGNFSGAPGHTGSGAVQHPDAVTLSTAVWACLGRPA